MKKKNQGKNHITLFSVVAHRFNKNENKQYILYTTTGRDRQN